MRYRQLISRGWEKPSFRFLVVGIANTAFGYSLYALLILVHMHYSVALVLASIGALFFNYRTIRSIAFQAGTRSVFRRFALVFAFLYVLNVGLLALFSVLSLHPLVGQLFALPVVVTLNYLLNKMYVFGVSA